METEEKIKQTNQKLKNLKLGVAIVLRGDKLSLRATLPPKPNSDKDRPYQQLISLGIYANPAGIKEAEARAIRLSGSIACREFSWSDWGTIEEKKSTWTIEAYELIVDSYEQVRERPGDNAVRKVGGVIKANPKTSAGLAIGTAVVGGGAYLLGRRNREE